MAAEVQIEDHVDFKVGVAFVGRGEREEVFVVPKD